VVWQYETYSYLSLSNVCQAAYHSNVFTSETERFQSVLFKRQDISSPWPFANETHVNSNGINTILWPPSGLLVENLKFDILNRYDVYHFRQRLNMTHDLNLTKDSVVDNPSSSFDIFIIIKAVHLLKSKKFLHQNAINIKIYHYNNESDFEFHFKRLLPHDESFVSYRKFLKTKLSNRTWSNFDHNLTQIDVDLTISHFDQIKMLNNYFELLNQDSNASVLKFPLNFALLNALKTSYSHTIHLETNQTQVLRLDGHFEPECKWYLLNIDLDIDCNTNLSIQYDWRLSEQNFIFYPHRYKSSLNVFARVIAIKNETSNLKCLNGGVLRDNKCLCLPGLNGTQCENVCSKNYFGHSCEIPCPNNECEGYLVCNKDPLGCSCLMGYKGFGCNQPCAQNEWGPECKLKCSSLCPNNLCDRFTGDCFCSNNVIGKKVNL
jgi:hypothetical protein